MDMIPPPVFELVLAAGVQAAAGPPAVRAAGSNGAAKVSEPETFYTGWLVDPEERQQLLQRFPPRYAEVVAHHVTHTFGDRQAKPPTETSGEVVGIADDGEGVQALVVRIGGTTDRWDGSTYHITWSLAPGREARESNDVLRHGWTRLPSPLPVTLHPRAFDD